jgi:DNA modification methylase
MKGLVEIVAPGGIVLDPFAGSGSTGVAAMQSGRPFIGIEEYEPALETCRERLAAAAQGLTLREARERQQVLFAGMDSVSSGDREDS